MVHVSEGQQSTQIAITVGFLAFFSLLPVIRYFWLKLAAVYAQQNIIHDIKRKRIEDLNEPTQGSCISDLLDDGNSDNIPESPESEKLSIASPTSSVRERKDTRVALKALAASEKAHVLSTRSKRFEGQLNTKTTIAKRQQRPIYIPSESHSSTTAPLWQHSNNSNRGDTSNLHSLASSASLLRQEQDVELDLAERQYARLLHEKELSLVGSFSYRIGICIFIFI